jgi:hypothetical protein
VSHQATGQPTGGAVGLTGGCWPVRRGYGPGTSWAGLLGRWRRRRRGMLWRRWARAARPG